MTLAVQEKCVGFFDEPGHPIPEVRVFGTEHAVVEFYISCMG
jgi:hypothetical protein